MFVRFKGAGEYMCSHLRSQVGLPACQHIRAARIDAGVADAFLTALVPAELDALSRARRTQQRPARNAVRAGVRVAMLCRDGADVRAPSRHIKQMHFVAHGMDMVSHEAPRLTDSGPIPYPTEDAELPLAAIATRIHQA